MEPQGHFFRHTDLGEYSAEASDLGLSPGDFPETLNAILPDRSLVPLQRAGMVTDREGDLMYVKYLPVDGKTKATFKVWND